MTIEIRKLSHHWMIESCYSRYLVQKESTNKSLSKSYLG